MAVIKDVAKLAGVSVGTVSKYLNSPQSLREDKRIAVEAAVKKLHYRPNLLARNLRIQNSRTIAVLAQEISNPFHATLFNTLRQEAAKYGYSVVLYSINDVNGDVNLLFETLPIYYFSGIVLCYFHDMKKSVEFVNKHTDIPIVIMSNTRHYFEEYEPEKMVYVDFGTGIKKACECLIRRGCKKITYIGCRTQNDDQEPKLNSFLSTMNTYGMRPHSVVRLENEYVMETGYEAAEITLQNKELPDAILCDTDILAVGVLRKLKNYGINVPEDMMLISCDDIDIASYYCPRLTTLHVPIQEISIKAMQLLIGQIENQKIDCNGREFELRLIERETTRRKSEILKK